MDAFPTFTLDEARNALPSLKPLLAELRETFHSYKFAKDQVDEMVGMHGHVPPTTEAGAELLVWTGKRDALASRVESLVRECNTLGADVKDPILGLVDFFARRGSEVVLLCYRDDEETITHWHPLDTGFAGRRPMSDF